MYQYFSGVCIRIIIKLAFPRIQSFVSFYKNLNEFQVWYGRNLYNAEITVSYGIGSLLSK